MNRFKLAPYEGIAKRRAILQHVGYDRWEPCAWIDYDDVSREEADAIANAALAGLLQLPDLEGPLPWFVIRGHGTHEWEILQAESALAAAQNRKDFDGDIERIEGPFSEPPQVVAG